MEYKILGRTGLEVSSIGLGTWAFGNQVYGGVTEIDGIHTIRHALHQGITLFDTAPQYGTHEQDGVAEIVLGKALKGDRQKTVIQTKFGRNPTIEQGAPQFYKKRIIASVEESLKRLQTDYIDVLFFHSPFSINEIHDDVWEGVDFIIQSGKVRFIGHSISMFKNTEHFALSWSNDGKIDVIQAVLSLMNREANALIEILSQQNIGIVARECLANGFLSGQVTNETVFPAGTLNSRYSRDEIIERVSQVDKFKFLLGRDITNMAQAAIRAMIDEPGISTVLTGAKNIKELDDAIIAANSQPFSPETIKASKEALVKNFEAA